MTFPPANLDPSIDPTRDAVRMLRDHGPDGPIVMLNLLRFRRQARYPPELGLPPMSGEEAYARYQEAFTRTVHAVSQAEVLFEGKAFQVFIGEEQRDRWHKVLLVRYPSRQHFLAMMADPAYRDALVHRYAGLEQTVLIPVST